MIDLDPGASWFLAAVAAAILAIKCKSQIKRSMTRRWLVVFGAALLASPVVVPGCPGMSIEPAWVCLLTCIRYPDLMAFLVLPFVLITTGVIGTVVEVTVWGRESTKP